MDEDWELAYRQARLELLVDQPAFDVDLQPHRDELARVLAGSRIGTTDLGRQLQQVIASPISTTQLFDVCAFSLLDDIEFKQALLAETDVDRRVRLTLEAIRQAHPHVLTPMQRFGRISPN
ncbi:MAG: hypothetical protein QM770_13460 [Tepidisphaeraceae bacterium]